MSEDVYPRLAEADGLEDLASTVDDYEKADQAVRSGLMLLYEENIRQLAGDQWTQFHGLESGDGDWEGPTGRQAVSSPGLQPRTNLIAPQVRALASMMVKNLPRGVASGKGDDRSRVLARTVEKLVEVLQEDNRAKAKTLSWALGAIVCGTAWKKNYVTWEVPLRAPEPLVPEGSEEAMLGPDGEPETLPLPEMEAVLRNDILMPHEIVPDVSATTHWGMEWIIERTIHPVQWYEGAYSGPEEEGYTGRAKEVKEESELSSPLNIWNRLKSVGPLWFGSYGATTDPKNSAVLKVAWIKPNKRFPGGLELHTANGIPLKVRGWKKGDRVPMLDTGYWHPYVPFGWFPQLGRFQSVSVVENLTSLQRRHNSINSLRCLSRGMTVAPKLLAPVGSELNVDHISGRPGEIIEYNASAADHPPSWLQPPSLSPDVNLEYTSIETEMKAVAGTDDPLSGARAEGVPSYAGQALVMERASDAHMATHLSFEEAIEIDTAMQVAMVSKIPELRDSPRYQKLLTEKLKLSGIEIDQLHLEDLSDSVVYRVEGGSSVPRSKVLFQQATMELVNMGAIDLQSSPEAHYKFLQQFGAEGFLQQSVHIKKAEVENVQLMRGGSTQDLISPFDDGQIHISSHTNCLMENWFTLGEAGRSALQEHITHHEQEEQRKMQQAAASEQQLTPPGAPPVQSQQAGPPNGGPPQGGPPVPQ